VAFEAKTLNPRRDVHHMWLTRSALRDLNKGQDALASRSQLGAQGASQADQSRLMDKEREAIALDLFDRKRKPIPIRKPKAC
jgi:hypothetical protein